MRFRLLPEAELELDGIWQFLARESANEKIADAQIDSLTDSFWLLGRHPRMGRYWNPRLTPGLRTFPVGQYVVFYRIGENELFILHILRGSRNIEQLLTP
jgi:toxin ParE1/3/4